MDPEPRGEPGATAGERRAGERHVSVLVLAKVTCEGVEQMCKVRDISSTGMRIETPVPLCPGQALHVEFRSGRRVEGAVRWVRERHAGVEFAAALAVEIMLGHAGPGTTGARLPRFERSADVIVTRASLMRPARLLNISLTGACLGDVDAFRGHDQVIVTVDGLAPRSGAVIWVEEQRVGIRFLQPIELAAFNAWLVA